MIFLFSIISQVVPFPAGQPLEYNQNFFDCAGEVDVLPVAGMLMYDKVIIKPITTDPQLIPHKNRVMTYVGVVAGVHGWVPDMDSPKQPMRALVYEKFQSDPIDNRCYVTQYTGTEWMAQGPDISHG